MDYVDLIFLDARGCFAPVEVTVKALYNMDMAKADRKRYLGVSVMYAWQLRKARFVNKQQMPPPHSLRFCTGHMRMF